MKLIRAYYYSGLPVLKVGLKNQANFVVTKDKVLWSSSTEAFWEILAEKGKKYLPEDVVRLSMAPPLGDMTRNLEEWQPVLFPGQTPPKWFDSTLPRVKEALKEWAKRKIIKKKRWLKDRQQAFVVSGNVYARDSVHLKVIDGIVRTTGLATVEAEGGEIFAYGRTLVFAYGHARVRAFDFARVWAWGPVEVVCSQYAFAVVNDDTRAWAKDDAVILKRQTINGKEDE